MINLSKIKIGDILYKSHIYENNIELRAYRVKRNNQNCLTLQNIETNRIAFISPSDENLFDNGDEAAEKVCTAIDALIENKKKEINTIIDKMMELKEKRRFFCFYKKIA